MNSFLVCVAVLGLASSSLGIDLPQYEPEMEECAKELGVELRYRSSDPIDVHNFKCIIRCMLIKKEVVKDDEIDMEGVQKYYIYVNDEHLEKIKLCTTKNKQQDPCDRIFAIKKCIETHQFSGLTYE